MGNGFVSAVHTGTGIEQEIPLNWFDVYPGQWRLAEDAPEAAAGGLIPPAAPSEIALAPGEVVLDAEALAHLSPDVLAQIHAAEAPATTPTPEGDAA